MKLVRIWLPAVVVIAGIVLWAVDPSTDRAEGAAAIVGAGLSIWLLNVLFRVGVAGERERDREDAARAFFDEHGYWPGEEEFGSAGGVMEVADVEGRAVVGDFGIEDHRGGGVDDR